MERARPSSSGISSGARWYHTIELPGGVVTPGPYDLREAARRVPMPESLAGKRCLDVGTRDGFWAFEMERRGAEEVIAIDLYDPERFDWPEPRPTLGEELYRGLGEGDSAFDVARRALGSRVERRNISVYDLPESDIEGIDFAFVGTLLMHLRDPVGALTAVRAVLDGEIVCNEVISVSLTLLRRSPTAALLTVGDAPFWWVPNVAGLRQYLRMAGFEVLDAGRPYLVRNGPGLRFPPLRFRRGWSLWQQLLLRRGAPHAWVRAKPRR